MAFFYSEAVFDVYQLYRWNCTVIIGSADFYNLSLSSRLLLEQANTFFISLVLFQFENVQLGF